MSSAITPSAPPMRADDHKAAARGRQLIPDDEAAQKQVRRLALLGAAGLLAGTLFASIGSIIARRLLAKRTNAKFQGVRT